MITNGFEQENLAEYGKKEEYDESDEHGEDIALDQRLIQFFRTYHEIGLHFHINTPSVFKIEILNHTIHPTRPTRLPLRFHLNNTKQLMKLSYSRI